jgi:hypothetical protein
MTTTIWITEQVAATYRHDAQQAAAARRLARQARGGPRTEPAGTATVRVPRPRRWVDAALSTVTAFAR